MGRLGRAVQLIAGKNLEASSPVTITDGYYIGSGQVRLPDNLIVRPVIPEHLTDYITEMRFEHGQPEPEDHQLIKVYNHLKEGDHVLVIRYAGRKKYAVLARLPA